MIEDIKMKAATDVAKKLLKLARVKELASRQYKDPPRGNGVMDAKHFKSGYTIRAQEIMGKKVTTISGLSPDGRHLLFFHGGSYVMEASVLHRRFIQILVKKYHMTVTFVDYPLAPEDTYQTTKAMVVESYRRSVSTYPEHTFFLFGDSAGGGLALALLQVLRKETVLPFPYKTVLCSPWLDLTLQNKQIPDYEIHDPILSVEGLRYAALLYSGGEDLSDPFLSPLLGGMDDLGEILLYVGTHEIFFPDCLALQKKIGNSKGSTLSMVIGEGMIHDWVLFPSKDARKVPAQLDKFLH